MDQVPFLVVSYKNPFTRKGSDVKETILIYQKEEKIVFPFDLAHIRRIEYEDDAPGGKQLERELKSTIENVLSLQVKQN